MYLPQYNLPPINPSAFGGLPQQGGPQGGPPPPQGVPQGPQGQPPMDMNKYLLDKVMEIKRRMGGGDPGALGAITEAMMQQPQAQQPQAQQPQAQQPQAQQPQAQQPGPPQPPQMRA